MFKENENEEQNQVDKAVDYEDVLKKIAFGRVHWILLLASGLFLMMASNEVLGMGMVAIASQCDLGLSSFHKGIMTGVSYLGSIFATYLWGYLSDTIGRRPIIIYSTIIGNGVSLISMFVSDFWIFVLLRFFVGFSICGATSVTFAYLGEFNTDSHRPVVINYASLFNALSCLYVPFITWLILLMNWSLEITADFHFHPWRLLLLFYLLPGFIGAIILLGLPESPKFLLAKNEHEKAYQALNWIYIKNGNGESLSDINIHQIRIPTNDKVQTFQITKENKCLSVMLKMWHDIRPLFQRPHFGNFVICCVITCCTFMCAVGFGIWFPEIQNRLSLNSNSNDDKSACEVINSAEEIDFHNATNTICSSTISDRTYIDYTIFGGLCLLGYLILGGIINILGRKLIVTAFLGFCCIFGICFLWIVNPIAIVLSFSLFLVLSELCMSIMNGIVVDLVPTYLRGQAVCCTLMVGRLGSVLATNFIGVMLETKCSATFLSFSLFAFVCAILALFLPV